MTSDPFPSPEAIEAFWSDDLGGHIKGGCRATKATDSKPPGEGTHA